MIRNRRLNACPELWEKANEKPAFISISFCFPDWKWSWRDYVLKLFHPKGIANSTRTALRKMTCTEFFKCKKKTESQYAFPKILFWRIWQPKLSELSRHFFFDIVRELSDPPSITFYIMLTAEHACRQCNDIFSLLNIVLQLLICWSNISIPL